MSKAQEAWERAAICGDRARAATDEHTRSFFNKLRNSWIRVAHNHQLAEYLDANGATMEAETPPGPSARIRPRRLHS
jgi:protein-disulfide isomerase